MNALLMASRGLQSIVDAPVWMLLLLKVTAILSIAWLAHLALARANPRWRIFLWRVTAVGLIVLPAAAWLLPALEIHVLQPPSVAEVTTAVPRWSKALPADWVAPRHAPVGSNVNLPDTRAARLLPISTNKQPEAMGSSALPQPQALAPATPKSAPVAWPALLLAAWLGGIAVLGFRLCLGHYRISAIARRAAPAAESVRHECLRVAEAIGCGHRVEVLQSSEIESPFLCGLLRPLLLLPARMREPSYRKDLPGILAHELTHVRSHDLPWNAGLQMISVVLWFHPLVWRMRKAHLAACELVCDAVSARFVGDVTDYCRTLARVAVDVFTSQPAAGIAMARVSKIGRRLNALKRKVFYLPLRRRSILAFGFTALVAAAVLGVLQFALAAPPPAKPAVMADNKETKSVEKEAKPVKDADTTPKAGSMRVLVLDPHGKPLPDANVHASIWTEEKDFKANHDYKTDAAGAVQVELPKTYTIVRLWASKNPFVTMFSHWEENELAGDTKLPKEYTIQLESGVAAGGQILDEAGKPIAGVKVQVSADGGKPSKGDGRTGYDMWLANGDDAVTTDADGRWRIDNVPDNAKSELRLMVSHPDYVSDDIWGQSQKDAGITKAMLLSETAKLTLKRGVIVQGRVTDPDGKPIKDALVVREDDPYMFSTSGVTCVFPTDAEGRYRMTAMLPGERVLTVIAPGWAPQLRRVKLQSGMAPQDFSLAPGKPIQLRFVDEAGKPIPGVEVMIEGWRGCKSLYNIKHPDIPDSKIPEKADKMGVWNWTWAPDDPVKLHCYSYPLKGFAPCGLEIAGGASPKTITLKSEHRITGRVIDAATGKPIPSFAVIPIDVFRKDWLHAERMNAKVGKDGRLDYLAERTDIPLRLRVEATGYRTETGPEFRVGDDTPRIQNFRLQPSEPVTGVVMDAAGKPVEKANVLLATPTEQAGIGGQNDDSLGNHKTSTNLAGRFEFPDPGELFTIVVQSDAGFAMADFPANQHDAGTLQIQSWASIRGRFRDGERLVKGAVFFLQLLRPDSLDQPRIVTNSFQIDTDAGGRFEFPRVPPLPVSIRATLGPWRDEGYLSGPSVPLDLQPGQQMELDLGGAGTIVKGKVTLTGKVPADLDCAYSINYLVSRTPAITPPPSIDSAVFDVRKGWQSTWLKSQEGQAYLNTLQHWFVKLAPDGAFRISGVPPGEYDLVIEIYAKPSGCLVDPLAQKVLHITVTAEDAARGELTLPEIAAAVVPVPAVGDTPSLGFQRADGGSGSLADFRGRFTVVHFWASWCGPCKQQIPAIKQLQEKFASHGPAMLSLSLDDDTAVWQAALKQLDLPWRQGRLVTAADAGISSVPAYWLLDPTGKIVAKVNDPDELTSSADNAKTEPVRNKAAIPFKTDAAPVAGNLRVLPIDAAGKPAEIPSPSANHQESVSTAKNTKADKTPEDTQPKPEPIKEDKPPVALTITVQAVDDVTGKPLADVPIVARAFQISTRKTDKISKKTDAEGNITFEIRGETAKIGDLSIEGRPAEYIPQYYDWTPNKPQASIPGQITMRFKKGITIGGQIQDSSGKPIADAKIELTMPATFADHHIHFHLGTLKSDKEGRWKCDVAPDDISEVRIYASHPDFIPGSAETTPAMKEQKHVLHLEQGLLVRGQVFDPQGQPAKGLDVSLGQMWALPNTPQAKTDAKGEFVLKNCPIGPSAVTVQGEGFAPQCQQLTVSKENPPLSFRLEPGATLRGRVVDQQGKPLEGIGVYADTWQDLRTLNFRATTDKEGRFIWKNAPRDTVIFNLSASGFRSDRNRPLTASDEEQTITLYPELLIRGTVVDEETGNPVDKFQYCSGFRRDTEDQSFFDNQFISGENGRFEYHMADASMPNNFVKVVAEGYNPAISRAFKPTEGQQSFEFKLKKGKGYGGVVLLPDGKPAQNAVVTLASKSSHPFIKNGELSPNSSAIRTTADAEGRFSFVPQTESCSFWALHQSGFGEISQYDLEKAGTIKLQPWGRLEGVVKIGNQIAKNVEVTYSSERFSNERGWYHQYETSTDDEGHFVFDRVYPSKGSAARVIVVDNGMMHAHAPTNPAPVEIVSGKTSKVEIGGKGRPVVGRIDTGGKITNWTNHGSLRPKYRISGEFSDYYSFKIESDGSFRIDDVAAGKYVLDLRITHPSSMSVTDAPAGFDTQIGHVNYDFSVPEMPEGQDDEPLDLGTIKATLYKVLNPGDPAPAFTAETIEDKKFSLQEQQGKVVLIKFWASRRDPRENNFPELKRVYERFHDNPKFVMIGLSQDQNKEIIAMFMKKEAISWPQAMIGANYESGVAADYGVRFEPAIFLVGSDGKIIGKDLHGAELEAAVEKALKP